MSLEVRIQTINLTFDVLLELDLTERPSYNCEKLLAYDSFLCGWCLEHPRYKTLGTRPVACSYVATSVPYSGAPGGGRGGHGPNRAPVWLPPAITLSRVPKLLSVPRSAG